MHRLIYVSLITCALAACTSRIELPGSVLPPQEELAAVEGLGAPVDWSPVPEELALAAFPDEALSLRETHPDSSSVHLRLLNAYFREDELAGVLDEIEWLAARDYAVSDAAQAAFRQMYNGDDLIRLEQALALAPQSFTASSQVQTIPETVHLPESVFFDSANDRYLVSSIVSRGLFVGQNGVWTRLPLENAGSLAGIALDAPRGLIWIGSGVVDQTPDAESAFRGVIAIDRNTLEELRRVPAPEGASISDIAVGPDGTVYGSDPIGGGVYSASLTDTAMQAFIPPGTFRSPQGIAVRPDNSALYVSDYRYGLAQVMIRSRHAYRMRTAHPVLLDGVDGLWLHGNELIAVQNGVTPMRITAFELGEGIGVIAEHRVLEMANPEWTEPLGGVISGSELHYIGTGQWDIWGEGGVLNEGAETRPSQIRSLPLVETPEEQG